MAGGIAQWWNACLAYKMSWVPFFVLKPQKIRINNASQLFSH